MATGTGRGRSRGGGGQKPSGGYTMTEGGMMPGDSEMNEG